MLAGWFLTTNHQILGSSRHLFKDIRYMCLLFIAFTELLACQPPFSQTAYSTVGTTIKCDYPGSTFKYDIYLCKEKGSVCEELSRTFIQRKTRASLSVTISNVSRRDQGVYWCVIKEGKYRAAFKRVELLVEGEKHTDTPHHRGRRPTNSNSKGF